MKKNILSFLLLVVVVIIGVGCKSKEKESQVINLKINDRELVVKLALIDDCYIKSLTDTEYEVYLGDKKCMVSTFLSKEQYEKYSKEICKTEGASIKGVGERDNFTYMFYELKTDDDIQYNRIVRIKEQEIYMIMYCYDNEDTAKKIFENISFTLN